MAAYFRLFGALLLALCGGGAGFAQAYRTVQRRKRLQQVCELLRALCEEIRYTKAELHALYRKLGTQSDRWQGLLNAAESFQTLTPPGELNREEAACFSECFGGLGSAGAEQECQRLEHYRAKFQTYCEAAAQEEAHAMQLYTKLGLGVGIMVGITVL